MIVIITEELIILKNFKFHFGTESIYVRIPETGNNLPKLPMAICSIKAVCFCCLLKSRHGHNTISSIFFIFYALNTGQNNIGNREIIP